MFQKYHDILEQNNPEDFVDIQLVEYRNNVKTLYGYQMCDWEDIELVFEVSPLDIDIENIAFDVVFQPFGTHPLLHHNSTYDDDRSVIENLRVKEKVASNKKVVLDYIRNLIGPNISMSCGTTYTDPYGDRDDDDTIHYNFTTLDEVKKNIDIYFRVNKATVDGIEINRQKGIDLVKDLWQAHELSLGKEYSMLSQFPYYLKNLDPYREKLGLNLYSDISIEESAQPYASSPRAMN